MKTRLKIVSTMISMCLALVVMGFAVWAALTQTLPVVNTVDFISIHVLSTVTGTVTGAKAETFANYGPVSTLAGDPEGKLGTWAIGSAMEFANETEPIVITLTIVNNSDERSLSFELSGQAYDAFNGTNLGGTNIDRTCVYSINNASPITNATYTSGAITVEALKTATIVTTLDISDNGKSVTAFNNGFSTTLRNIGAATENFSFNPVAKTISLNTAEPLTEENIPEMIVEGEPAYYGLYEDQDYTQKVELPYSGSSTLYAKFGNPTNITFNSINSDTEYSVEKNASSLPTGSLVIPEKYNWKPVTTISNSAFGNLAGLTSITFPDSLTNIGKYAFYSCTGLTNLTIPSNMISIEDGAFYNCTNLTEINFNATNMSNCFKDFGNLAFYKAGTNGNGIIVNVAANVTRIPANIFCSGNSSDNPIIKALNFAENSACISIGAKAFWCASILTSLSLPDGLTSIGMAAFLHCTGIPSITIPSTVTSIGSSAFEHCTRLSSITIPDGLTNIYYSTFKDCTSLTYVNIPESVINIEASAFINTAWYNSKPNGLIYAGKVAYKYKGTMPANTSINLNNDTVGTSNGIFENCTGLTSITIPSSLKSIGYGSFYGCTGLAIVTIPSGVTIVGNSAFYGCSNLTSITIPSSVTTIGANVFSYCTNLTTITFQTGNKLLENDFQNDSYGSVNNYFKNCTSITTINVPSDLTKIGSYVFYGCTNLTNITIPNSVTSIGKCAFHNCTALANITIPDNINSIGGNAFYNTAWYGAQSDGLIYVGKVVYKYKGMMPSNTSITLLPDTKEIAGNAFQNCTGLTSITIPSSVTSIGTFAFQNCKGLTSVTIPSSVTTISSCTFEYCSKLTSVTIPNSVTSIGNQAFRYCTSLITIAIPDSIVNIGNSAFSGCTGLTSITIPSGVTSIGGCTFENCTGLTNITIPNSVTSIGDHAFFGCAGLTGVTIPSNVTNIDSSAFSLCLFLTEIIVNENNEDYKSIDGILFNKAGTILICYPCNKSGTEYEIANGVTEISDSAFYGNKNLTSLTISSSVVTIGEKNNYFTNLQELIIYSSIVTNTSVSSNIFYLLTEAEIIYVIDTINPTGQLFEQNEFVTGTYFGFIEDGPDGYCDDENYRAQYFTDNYGDGYCDNCGRQEWEHDYFYDENEDGCCDGCGLTEGEHDEFCDAPDGYDDIYGSMDLGSWKEVDNYEFVYAYFEPATSDKSGYTMWTKVTTDYNQWN
ncbi:MAG: leucine-rich repeat domain-containing protein [Clostridia bacterium]